ERENTSSAVYADEYVAHFLEAEAAPGIAFEYELVQRLLPEVGLDEVDALAGELLAEDNRIVLVQMPEKAGVAVPAEADLAAVLTAVAGREVAAYEDAMADRPLLEAVPAPAAVTARREIASLGVTEVT